MGFIGLIGFRGWGIGFRVKYYHYGMRPLKTIIRMVFWDLIPSWRTLEALGFRVMRDSSGWQRSLLKLLMQSLRFSEAPKGGMKVGRIKDPLYKDYYWGISHLPSPHLLRPPSFLWSRNIKRRDVADVGARFR